MIDIFAEFAIFLSELKGRESKEDMVMEEILRPKVVW